MYSINTTKEEEEKNRIIYLHTSIYRVYSYISCHVFCLAAVCMVANSAVVTETAFKQLVDKPNNTVLMLYACFISLSSLFLSNPLNTILLLIPLSLLFWVGGCRGTELAACKDRVAVANGCIYIYFSHTMNILEN